MPRSLLLTGAAGILGRWLRPKLLEKHKALRSSDIKDPGPALKGEEVVVGPAVTDETWRAAILQARPGRWVAQRYFDAKADVKLVDYLTSGLTPVVSRATSYSSS